MDDDNLKKFVQCEHVDMCLEEMGTTALFRACKHRQPHDIDLCPCPNICGMSFKTEACTPVENYTGQALKLCNNAGACTARYCQHKTPHYHSDTCTAECHSNEAVRCVTYEGRWHVPEHWKREAPPEVIKPAAGFSKVWNSEALCNCNYLEQARARIAELEKEKARLEKEILLAGYNPEIAEGL